VNLPHDLTIMADEALLDGREGRDCADPRRRGRQEPGAPQGGGRAGPCRDPGAEVRHLDGLTHNLAAAPAAEMNSFFLSK
jgi:hypothetical protein